ncbi:MAG: hypothetical protein AAF846_28085 [Chloroflexota bacterium]
MTNSLRKLYESLSNFVVFMFGRDADEPEEVTLPTQRNRYFT